MIIGADINIEIGSHISKCRVIINGKNVPVSDIHIFVSGSNPYPKVGLTIPLLNGKILKMKAEEADVTIDELVNIRRKNDGEKKTGDTGKGAKRVRKG